MNRHHSRLSNWNRLEDRVTPVIGTTAFPFTVDPRTTLPGGITPWSIVDLNNDCTATLMDPGFGNIGSRYVLTAAHCLIGGERQEIDIPVEIAGDSFQLQFTVNSQTATTTALDPTSDASVVQAALEALPNIGAGNVAVSRGTEQSVTGYTVQFLRAFNGVNVPDLVPVNLVNNSGQLSVTVGELEAGFRVDVSSVTFYLPNSKVAGLNGDVKPITIPVMTTFLLPTYPGAVNSDVVTLPGDDIAVLVLSAVAPFEAKPIALNTTTDEVGKPMRIIGYGRTGDGTQGEVILPEFEYQRLRVNATGGTYRLGLDGNFTAPIAANATAPVIQAALAALPGLSLIEVRSVTRGPETGTFEIAFLDTTTNFSQLTVDSANLTGTVAVNTIQNGGKRVMRTATNTFSGLDTLISVAGLSVTLGDPNVDPAFIDNGLLGGGDSGGPALLDLGGGNVVIAGVASYGSEKFGETSTYARVSTYATQIKGLSVINDPYLLTIDMKLQGRGDDGVPDTLTIRTNNGFIEVFASIGTGPAVLVYREQVARVTGISILGSDDDDTLIVSDKLGVTVSFDGRGGTNKRIDEQADSTPPTATLGSASNVTNAQAGSTVYLFTVVYADNQSVDTLTLGGQNILVTGPNGFSQLAEFVGVDVGSPGTPRTATYRITPPGGAWSVSGNGTYTISLQANQVRDIAGNPAAAGVLGTFVVNLTPPPPVLPGPNLIGVPQFAVGSGPGTPSRLQFFGPDQSPLFSSTPFPGFNGGVRTAAGDFNGDGVTDVVVGTGPGTLATVSVIDGKTQATLFSITPFDNFRDGVFVAVGDLNGDGVPDLAISPDEGGGPRVRVFSGKGFGQLADFFGIDDDSFRGGARIALGDLNGDGKADLLVAAGFGGGPRVAAFNGAALTSTGGPKLFSDFFLFEPGLRNGVFVAAGDLDGDGFAELIGGAGPGGGPRVFALSGRELVQNNGQQVPRANFFGGDDNNRGGIRVAVKNLDGDSRADLLVGAGLNAGSRVTAYLGKNIASQGTPTTQFAFDALPGFAGGVFVG